MTEDESDILTLKEVCQMLKLSDKTVYSMVEELKGFKLGNKWRFRRSCINSYIDSKINRGSEG